MGFVFTKVTDGRNIYLYPVDRIRRIKIMDGSDEIEFVDDTGVYGCVDSESENRYGVSFEQSLVEYEEE